MLHCLYYSVTFNKSNEKLEKKFFTAFEQQKTLLHRHVLQTFLRN